MDWKYFCKRCACHKAMGNPQAMCASCKIKHMVNTGLTCPVCKKICNDCIELRYCCLGIKKSLCVKCKTRYYFDTKAMDEKEKIKLVNGKTYEVCDTRSWLSQSDCSIIEYPYILKEILPKPMPQLLIGDGCISSILGDYGKLERLEDGVIWYWDRIQKLYRSFKLETLIEIYRDGICIWEKE